MNQENDTVTKKEFRTAMENIDQRFEKIDRRFEMIDQRFEKIDQRLEKIDQRFNSNDIKMAGFVTKVEFHDAIRRLEEKMYTKEDHAKYMDWLDEAITELRDMREERILTGHQLSRMSDTVFDHEKRIKNLEESQIAA